MKKKILGLAMALIIALGMNVVAYASGGPGSGGDPIEPGCPISFTEQVIELEQ